MTTVGFHDADQEPASNSMPAVSLALQLHVDSLHTHTDRNNWCGAGNPFGGGEEGWVCQHLVVKEVMVMGQVNWWGECVVATRYVEVRCNHTDAASPPSPPHEVRSSYLAEILC
jgi:hypothetical protein